MRLDRIKEALHGALAAAPSNAQASQADLRTDDERRRRAEEKRAVFLRQRRDDHASEVAASAQPLDRPEAREDLSYHATTSPAGTRPQGDRAISMLHSTPGRPEPLLRPSHPQAESQETSGQPPDDGAYPGRARRGDGKLRGGVLKLLAFLLCWQGACLIVLGICNAARSVTGVPSFSIWRLDGVGSCEQHLARHRALSLARSSPHVSLYP